MWLQPHYCAGDHLQIDFLARTRDHSSSRVRASLDDFITPFSGGDSFMYVCHHPIKSCVPFSPLVWRLVLPLAPSTVNWYFIVVNFARVKPLYNSISEALAAAYNWLPPALTLAASAETFPSFQFLAKVMHTCFHSYAQLSRFSLTKFPQQCISTKVKGNVTLNWKEL